MSEDVEALAAHRRAVEATIPLLGAIQSIAEMAHREAERAGAPVKVYTTRVRERLNALVASLEAADRRQLLARMTGSGPSVMVVIGSERGLCGAFNDRLVRQAVPTIGQDTLVVCWGRRGERLLRSTGHVVTLSAPLPSLGVPRYADIEGMTLDILELVEQRNVSRLLVLSCSPVHGFQYAASVRQVLPLPLTFADGPSRGVELKPPGDIVDLFVHLVSEYVLTELYDAAVESAISEQLARVAAMRLASENARNLLDDLTAQYNLARQRSVTQSLLEIVAGYQTPGV
ncbi:MAG TPA: F0F1 ATP synthase subunit gamma [Chloroflexota bacterium]|jgi:F-type H+-transporting ATPase subunit gamma